MTLARLRVFCTRATGVVIRSPGVGGKGRPLASPRCQGIHGEMPSPHVVLMVRHGRTRAARYARTVGVTFHYFSCCPRWRSERFTALHHDLGCPLSAQSFSEARRCPFSHITVPVGWQLFVRTSSTCIRVAVRTDPNTRARRGNAHRDDAFRVSATTWRLLLSRSRLPFAQE